LRAAPCDAIVGIYGVGVDTAAGVVKTLGSDEAGEGRSDDEELGVEHVDELCEEDRWKNLVMSATTLLLAGDFRRC